MNKIYSKKSNLKAFTLIELIVVITILAVLGTIAFMSFEGYTMDARNAKRGNEMKSIQKAINITMAESGESILSFIVEDDAQTLTGKHLITAGYYGTGASSGEVVTSDLYRAGITNFQFLEQLSDGISDPLSGENYKIGAQVINGQWFEIAGTIEGEERQETLIVGNYMPRSLTGSVSAKIEDSGYVTLSRDPGFSRVSVSQKHAKNLKKGDVVKVIKKSDGSETGSRGKIISIKRNRIRLVDIDTGKELTKTGTGTFDKSDSSETYYLTLDNCDMSNGLTNWGKAADSCMETHLIRAYYSSGAIVNRSSDFVPYSVK